VVGASKNTLDALVGKVRTNGVLVSVLREVERLHLGEEYNAERTVIRTFGDSGINVTPNIWSIVAVEINNSFWLDKVKLLLLGRALLIIGHCVFMSRDVFSFHACITVKTELCDSIEIFLICIRPNYINNLIDISLLGVFGHEIVDLCAQNSVVADALIVYDTLLARLIVGATAKRLV
jgi:hypothetical protein